jgi:hypothetical protein
VVEGVVSLHNIPRRALHQDLYPFERRRDPAQHCLTPGDLAAIYNLQPLYLEGIDGSGVTIAVVGRTHIPPRDVLAFRRTYGLPPKAPEILVNGADPGDLGTGEDGEANLDLEWSGAAAPDATIRFVASASTETTDGVDLSAQFIVDRNLAPIVTASFGQCEGLMGRAERAFFRNLWAQAAVQGISVVVAAGDSGCSGCDQGTANTGTGRAVNGLASTPFNLAVGGTQFHEGTGTYWSDRKNPDGSSALGYIPEQAWNESGAGSGYGLWATGGGASCCYRRPRWQLGPGVPRNEGFRYLPDVSLAAAGLHDPYVVETDGTRFEVGGTSCAAPAFAGILALVVQRTGERQGNPGPALYALGAAQYRGAGPAVFHDITEGNNNVPGVKGWSCTRGYDLATGLGSVDGDALVTAWTAGVGRNVDAVIQAPAADPTVPSGTAVAFRGIGRVSAPGAVLGYAWDFGDGVRASGPAVVHTFSNTASPAPVPHRVVLTVADGSGASCSDARTVTVVPAPAPGELIRNGGFELGATGWTARNVAIGVNGGWAPAHLGTQDAWFSGWLMSGPEELQQDVAIPAQARSAVLTFWLAIQPQGSATQGLDLFQVKARGADGRLAILGTLSNLDDQAGFRQHRIDLGAYRGQKVQLSFVASDSPVGLNTSFTLDDVSLIAQ